MALRLHSQKSTRISVCWSDRKCRDAAYKTQRRRSPFDCQVQTMDYGEFHSFSHKRTGGSIREIFEIWLRDDVSVPTSGIQQDGDMKIFEYNHLMETVEAMQNRVDRMQTLYKDQAHLRACITGRKIVDDPSLRRGINGALQETSLVIRNLIGSKAAGEDLRQLDHFYWLAELEREGLTEAEHIHLQELGQKAHVSKFDVIHAIILLGKQAQWRERYKRPHNT